MGALDRAKASYRRVLALNPNTVKAWNNLGAILQGDGALDEAAAQYERAIGIKPDYAEAHNNLGGVHRRRGANDKAEASYRRALEIQPDYAEAHYNLAIILKGKGAMDAAAASCARAIEIEPDYAEAHNTLGVILQETGALDAAIERYHRAVALKPDYAEAHNNLGAAFEKKGAFEDSVASYRRALDINPAYAEAHNNLGVVLQNKAELDQSVANYIQALEINPAYSVARAHKLHQQAHLCDWEAIRQDADFIPTLGIEGESVPPFALLVMDDNPERNRLRAINHVAEKYTRLALPAAPRPAEKPQRLRIGYFSADFHNHATMYLMAKLFTVHDRSQFEIHAFSYGPDRQDEMRRRLVASVDGFHDISGLADEAAARLARDAAIDIAVDLKGFTQHSRLGIFAYRAAPVQIAYLGYPGTTGAEFMDYMIADETVIPATHRQYYCENIITLPHSYQVNDDTRAISQRTVTRAECGLPQDGFVFCCFNTTYKLGPDEFDIWMRLLCAVEGSVLWLMKSNKWVEARLRAQAEARNVDPGRIVFAERLPLDEHLARCGVADLFLDTFACNAHTTASDALWAGLPLVTKLGQGFAARVAGSLLNAVGLPELITQTPAAYETLALDLARDPQKLAAVKAKLARNRETEPLFDSELFVRHLEDAYRQAYQLYFDGREPTCLTVAAGPEHSAPGGTGPQVDPTLTPAASPAEKIRDLLALYGQGKLADALRIGEQLADELPEYALLHNFLGAVNADLKRLDDAVANYRRALEIDPDYVIAHFNLGIALQARGALDGAAASYARAIEIKPDYADAHYNLGLVLQSQGALDAAVARFRRTLEIDPGFDKAREQKLHQQAQMCDWAAIREDAACIPKLGIEGAGVSPFSMLAMEDAPARHRLRSERVCRDLFKQAALPAAPAAREKPQRLRIGYFSADFHDHATMYLMAKLFEAHDRNHFEIHAYSYGPDKQDEMRKRLVEAVDGFEDVRDLTDEAAAVLARQDRLDIAVDLKGHTQHARLGIFAHRAAPVQISYLGYPGTTGAEFMDYLIADETVIPEHQRPHYSESLIHLPHSYQVNDDSRRISQRPATRAEFGLPEDGFVFCCFNTAYKFGPAEFDIWMRLLSKVEGSVLWLLKSNKWAQVRLRAEAEARNVDGARLVFAERLPVAEHLARYQCADLFLDSFNYNAHTTASDALWAGLPLVTRLGEGFAARVAGSLLNAVGLPELITRSAADYESLALELARDRQKHQALRGKLESNRSGAPLFDTALFVRHLEEAYRQAWQRNFDGKQPALIKVAR